MNHALNHSGRLPVKMLPHVLKQLNGHLQNTGYFRGGGFSSQFDTKGTMPITISRVNLVKGLGPVLQLAEGWTVELPEKMNKILTDRTNPTWPTTWFAPRLTGKGPFTDVYSVMANWGANHSASSYGHIGADLITLASILRIPVCMHNVDEEKYSDQVHGMHLEWIRKDLITGHVRPMGHCINRVVRVRN